MNIIKILVAILVLATPTISLGAGATAPIVSDNGTITCPTCVNSSATMTANGIPYGNGSKALAGVALNSSGTKMYLSQTSSGTPAFAQVAIGDLASMTSAALYGQISDETGSASGTPIAVFNQNPTINGVTGTGTWNLTGATVNLPSGAVDAIGEIATGIKSGGANAVTVATVGSTPLVNGQCVQVDADGNLAPSGGSCGGTSLNPRIIIHSQTPVTVASATPVYMSLGGGISTTEASVRTPFPANTTFGAMSCIVTSNTTNAITATLGTAGCTSTANVTSKLTQTLSATANTVASDSGSTAISADNCGVIKLTAGTDAAATDIICTLEITG
jgi:hypothetical protein